MWLNLLSKAARLRNIDGLKTSELPTNKGYEKLENDGRSLDILRLQHLSKGWLLKTGLKPSKLLTDQSYEMLILNDDGRLEFIASQTSSGNHVKVNKEQGISAPAIL